MKHISRIAALILAVMVLCTGCGSCVAPHKYNTTVAATYGDQTTYLDEANFWLRLGQWGTESYTGMMYYYYYGVTNIWSISSGVRTQNYEQTLKENVMAEILQTYVVLDHASEYPSELTAEESTKIDELITRIREDYADEFFTLAGIAEGDAGNAQMKAYFEKRVKAYKIVMGAEDAAQVSVSDEECKSFRIAYLTVPAETESSTEATESTEAAPSAALTGKALAEQILSELQAGKSWEITKENWSDLKGSETTFAYSDTDATSVFYKEGKDMKTGEAKVVDRESGGWYVIYSVSDDDKEAAETNRANMLEDKKVEAFNELYKTWAASAKTFKVSKEFRNLKVEPSYVAKAATTTEEPSSEAETTTEAANN